MKYIKPKKLQILLVLFFCSGIMGIIVGLSQNALYITFLGVINICLGGFIGWLLLTQEPKSEHRRKKYGK